MLLFYYCLLINSLLFINRALHYPILYHHHQPSPSNLPPIILVPLPKNPPYPPPISFILLPLTFQPWIPSLYHTTPYQPFAPSPCSPNVFLLHPPHRPPVPPFQVRPFFHVLSFKSSINNKICSINPLPILYYMYKSLNRSYELSWFIFLYTY